MKIYWPNLKKYLILSFCISLTTVTSPYGNTSVPSEDLSKEISAWNQRSFEPLIERWEKKYGSNATKNLALIAKNKKLGDRERYIALMGAAKLGGMDHASSLWTTLIKDRSWVIRSAVLRALRLDQSKKHGALAIQSLKDPALVVRLEAIDTVSKLKPEGWEKAILGTLSDSRNFHNEEPLWVPARALKALKTSKQPEKTIQELTEALKNIKNKNLKVSTEETIHYLKSPPST